MSDLFGNHIVGFSHNAAHFQSTCHLFFLAGPDQAVLAKRKQSHQDHLGIPDVLGRDSFLK